MEKYYLIKRKDNEKYLCVCPDFKTLNFYWGKEIDAFQYKDISFANFVIDTYLSTDYEYELITKEIHPSVQPQSIKLTQENVKEFFSKVNSLYSQNSPRYIVKMIPKNTDDLPFYFSMPFFEDDNGKAIPKPMPTFYKKAATTFSTAEDALKESRAIGEDLYTYEIILYHMGGKS